MRAHAAAENQYFETEVMMVRRLVLVGIVCAILTACASERAPVQEEELFSWFGNLEYSYIATAPERRIVVFRFDDNLVCAEPPADAADQVASALAAGLKGEYQGIGADFKFSNELATTVKQLGRRTQALQLYRDRVFNLCVMLLNGKISGSEYVAREQEAFQQSNTILQDELKYFYEVDPKTYDDPEKPSLRSAAAEPRT
jgi:hypothetical protein